MYLDFLSQADVVKAISISITLAFIVSIVVAYKNCRNNPSVFIAAAVLAANFVIANNAVYEMLGFGPKQDLDFYLRWVEYNSLTIIAIIVIHLLTNIKHHKITVFSMYLLQINIIAYIAMHVDIIVKGNREPWILWQIYTPVVNVTEISIAMLIIAYSINYLRKDKTEKEGM